MHPSTSKTELKKKNVFSLFGQLKSEVRLVSWTSQIDLINYTKVIVICAVALGMLIYLNDLVAQNVLQMIKVLARLVTR